MQVPQAMRAFQAVGEHEGFVVQEFPGQAFGHDFAVVKDDHSGT